MKFRNIVFFLIVSLLLSGCGLLPDNTAVDETLMQGYDYASGVQNFSVLLNGVGLQVEAVDLRSSQRAGYTYLILSINAVNESKDPVVPGGFILVDDALNEYVSQQTAPFAAELTDLPLAINQGDSVAGHAVFEVPNSALQANLRLRWESDLHESRIEIFLGALPAV
ncbi:MAG: hypothetical protein KC421_11070 [Anaerolineales bacterium]|nr:hypothetical protein [Anaerolineales bacterium]